MKTACGLTAQRTESEKDLVTIELGCIGYPGVPVGGQDAKTRGTIDVSCTVKSWLI